MTAESSSLNVFGYAILVHAQTDYWPSCSPLALCIISPLTVTFPKLAVIVRPLYSADIFDAGWLAGEGEAVRLLNDRIDNRLSRKHVSCTSTDCTVVQERMRSILPR
jgi:hypothetical protein